MPTYFISRHPGARAWASEQGIGGTWIEHLDPTLVAAGDQVIGTLPVNLAAEVCLLGASYWHLAMNVPPEARGKELTAEQMRCYDVRLVCYHVHTVGHVARPGSNKLADSPAGPVPAEAVHVTKLDHGLQSRSATKTPSPMPSRLYLAPFVSGSGQ
jgi:CRISPR-associated protein Csx16